MLARSGVRVLVSALRVGGLAAQGSLVALVGWNTLTAVPGWRNQPRPGAGARVRRFRVVVPAHDEEAVLGGLLDELAGQDYPAALIQVWVVADRCTDATVALARARGTQVAERTTGAAGKGPALTWYLERDPLGDDEALVVLDADNRVPPDLLSRFDDALSAGAQALQAYLDVLDPEESTLATASALTYWAGNRMVQLARSNLGWPAELGGTGMCLTAAALKATGGFGATVTEDQELTAKLALSGIAVLWLHDVRIRDEKPDDLAVAVRQRARWMAGKREVRRRHGGALVRRGLAQRDLGALDLALRLVQPGRSFVALLCGLALAATAFPSQARPWMLPRPVWAGAVAAQLGLPPLFLARDGVPARWVVRFPLVSVYAVLWIPIRLASRGAGARWFHTPHGRSTPT